MTTLTLSLAQLERLIAERNWPAALQLVLAILQRLDERYGRLDGVELGDIVSDGSDEDFALVFCTRFADCIGRILTAPELEVSAADYERLLQQHRWIDLVFSLSGFRTSDPFLQLLASRNSGGQMTFAGANFPRLLALLSLNSRITADIEQFWQANRVSSALAFLHYIASRYVFSPRAFEFREKLLEWLPARLDDVKLGSLTLSRLPEIYMHCSYAITPRKHAIKGPLMEQMRRACLDAGCVENPAPLPPRGTKWPTIVVVGEHLLEGHAVYRTHSKSVASLRERFNVVGIVHPNPIGTPIASYFDESIPIPVMDFMSSLKFIAEEIAKRKPAAILYLGVGMVPQIIGLASLRLAPIQCVSFGHTATTMSKAMDYFILPEDFVGAHECFSEKVIGLPKAAMPFAPRPFQAIPRPPSDGIVRIAIPASTMKLNPHLFEALARIEKSVQSDCEFHLMPLAGTGLAYVELARILRSRVPTAVVFSEAPHDIYMERLAACDFFLCPFPYGNMNSIIDCFRLGLPGICLDGAEAHAHADAAIFARIGLPHELAAQTIDAYVAATVKMVDDAKWRQQCRSIVESADLDRAFFTGDASLFAKALEDLIWPLETA